MASQDIDIAKIKSMVLKIRDMLDDLAKELMDLPDEGEIVSTEKHE